MPRPGPAGGGGPTTPARSGPPGPPAPATVGDVGEFRLIDQLTTDRRQPDATLLGPGDDAALLAVPDGRVVASTDLLVEGVHFRLDWSAPELVGRKAVAVNAADIAAMGAVTTGLLVGVGCPAGTAPGVLTGLTNGMWQEAAALGPDGRGAGLIGGDMVTADKVVISITALGDLQGRPPVTRAGARVGDVVALCGRLGWSAAGLAVLGRGFRSPAAVVGAHRLPEPPYPAGPQAAEAGATAMIDVSDGLLADLGHVATASGVGIDLRSGSLEVHQRLVDVGSALGVEPLDWVLTGGEDHALVATYPSAGHVPPGWTVIGAVVAASGVLVDGRPYEVSSPGWQHWRR